MQKIILALFMASIVASCGSPQFTPTNHRLSAAEWASIMADLPPHYIQRVGNDTTPVFIYTGENAYNEKGKIVDTFSYIWHQIRPYAKSFIKASNGLVLPFWIDIYGTYYGTKDRLISYYEKNGESIPCLRVQFYEKSGDVWRYMAFNGDTASNNFTELRQGILGAHLECSDTTKKNIQ